MQNPNLRPLSLGLFAAMVLSSGCAVAGDRPSETTTTSSAETVQARSVTIDLPKESLFSVIAADNKATTEARQAYQLFQSEALPMASEYGFRRHSTLVLNGSAIGSFEPQAFLLTSWPNQKAFESFQSDPRWTEFAALRPSIWDDIRYYRDVREEGLSLTIRSDKFYTLAIVSINQRNPGHYDEYLTKLEGTVKENGGRFILTIRDADLESLSGTKSPDQMTFIEWDDENGVDRLLGSETYKANRHLAASGTTELSFFRLKPSL